MATPETVSETWLTDVLSGLGNTADDIAATLRNAKITGSRQSMRCCPVARFVADRIARDIPSAQVKVAITSDTALITRTAHKDDEYGDVLVSAELPDPVVEFIDRFDSSAFPDLIDNSTA